MAKLRRPALLLGACCTVRSGNAFTTPPTPATTGRRSATAALHSYNSRNSPGFVGFAGDDSPVRDYDGGSYSMMRGGQQPRVTERQSNLSRRGGGRAGDSPYDRPSVNDVDPRAYDIMERRYSQPPHPSMMAPPHVQQQTRGYDGRIQGGSRHTYQNSNVGPGGYGSGRTFVESDGRPLNVEMEVWDGPANTPTKVKMYSEDGRRRPMNILTNSGRGMTSVRNVGSMEFPIRAGVSMGGGPGYNGGMEGMMGEYNNGYGGMDMDPRPSTARGETVQGGSLKTFSLNPQVNAVQVTITSDGLPVQAKVELWGTSTQIKQLAEVYNDNGQTRPFAAIIDVPGGENTIAIRNTGPLEYPIRVVVEPVGGGGGGGAGGMGMDYGMMMDGGGQYGLGRGGPPMGMMDRPMLGGGFGPPMMGGPYLPPPPF